MMNEEDQVRPFKARLQKMWAMDRVCTTIETTANVNMVAAIEAYLGDMEPGESLSDWFRRAALPKQPRLRLIGGAGRLHDDTASALPEKIEMRESNADGKPGNPVGFLFFSIADDKIDLRLIFTERENAAQDFINSRIYVLCGGDKGGKISIELFMLHALNIAEGSTALSNFEAISGEKTWKLEIT
jgi:hypothetical protein